MRIMNSRRSPTIRWIAVVLITVVTGIWSWAEIRFLLQGVVTDAVVTDAHLEDRSIRRRYKLDRHYQVLVVTYHFTDQTGLRHDKRDEIAFYGSIPSETMRVQYLPNQPTSVRPVGQENFLPLIVFLISGAWLMFLVRRAFQQDRLTENETTVRPTTGTTTPADIAVPKRRRQRR
jgi:hypothetical protein